MSAGLTLRNFYFRLYPGAIGQVEVIDFLKALLRHIDKPLLIVWDRLPAHRSRLVREFIELSEGHIVMEYLPPYAPELNPVEYICMNGGAKIDHRAAMRSPSRAAQN